MSDFSILDPFKTITVPVGSWVEAALRYLVHNFREVFRSIRWPVDQVLDGIQATLMSVPRPCSSCWPPCSAGRSVVAASAS